MISFCIASPHKNILWYDYRLYVNLKYELEQLGYQYRSASRNRIYFLGAPQRHFYNEVGKFDPTMNNIAVIYCHAEQLGSLSQFNKVFVCSEGVGHFLRKKRLYGMEFLKKKKVFTSKTPIDILRPFSSLTPARTTMPKYECDVSFMGTPRTRPILDAVLPLVDELGIKLNLYGPGWDNYTGGVNLKKYWVARQIPYEDIPKLAKGSKICLIDHHETMNKIGSVSHKYIDFIMAGGFVVSDYNRDAIKYYKGICFSEKRPLKGILREYLADGEKRKEHTSMQQLMIIDQTTHIAACKLAACFV